jgi:hypothetical protein
LNLPCNTTRFLDDLDAAEDVATRVGERLAILQHNGLRNLVVRIVEQSELLLLLL